MLRTDDWQIKDVSSVTTDVVICSSEDFFFCRINTSLGWEQHMQSLSFAIIEKNQTHCTTSAFCFRMQRMQPNEHTSALFLLANAKKTVGWRERQPDCCEARSWICGPTVCNRSFVFSHLMSDLASNFPFFFPFFPSSPVSVAATTPTKTLNLDPEHEEEPRRSQQTCSPPHLERNPSLSLPTNYSALLLQHLDQMWKHSRMFKASQRPRLKQQQARYLS